MSHIPSNVKQPVGSRWDIEFTRMSYVVRRRLALCMKQLSILVRNAGLQVEPTFRLHGGGLSGSLNIVGKRGALASLEFHLVDGMAEAGVAGAAIDVNLLASDGEVVAFCTPVRPVAASGFRAQPEAVLSGAGVGLDANTLYAHLVKFFDLALECPRSR